VLTTAPDCITAGTETAACITAGCGVEGTRPIPALGHSYGSWTVTTSAGIDQDGIETRICAVCDETNTRPIPGLIVTPGLYFWPIDNETAYSVSRGEISAATVVIPAMYNGLPVTQIRAQGFMNYSTMTSIIIPDSVTSIGSSAFESCTGLTSITIPDSVTSIGHRAFQGCTGLTSIVIPDSVTSIGEGAFRSTKFESAVYKGTTYKAEIMEGFSITIGDTVILMYDLPQELYDLINN
jgi:hypothetical protein